MQNKEDGILFFFHPYLTTDRSIAMFISPTAKKDTCSGLENSRGPRRSKSLGRQQGRTETTNDAGLP